MENSLRKKRFLVIVLTVTHLICIALGTILSDISSGAVDYFFKEKDRASERKEKRTEQIKAHKLSLIEASEDFVLYVHNLYTQEAYIGKMIKTFEPQSYEGWAKKHLPPDKFIRSKLPPTFFKGQHYNWLGFRKASNQAVTDLTWLANRGFLTYNHTLIYV